MNKKIIVVIIIMAWVFSPTGVLINSNCNRESIIVGERLIETGPAPEVIAICQSISLSTLLGVFVWPPVISWLSNS